MRGKEVRIEWESIKETRPKRKDHQRARVELASSLGHKVKATPAPHTPRHTQEKAG